MLIPPSTASSLRRLLARPGVLMALATSLLLGLTLPHAALAGAPAKPKTKAREPFKPPYDVIQSVDPVKKTVVVAHVNSPDHSVKTYVASTFCEVQVNGAKAQFDALKAGLKVSIGKGGDGTVADSITAGPPPPEPTPFPTKAKKK